ncbi:RnfH family protein [Pseudoxanthomonas sp. PXM02]|uniref:RnfH family protein n=1 Tax=Pseudoxanthomonas sp. PXM02 TaxID=2769294 RepID=UPI00177F9A95|nr:RnfH family protein [Pseudoxanthomonas sp. PXM02]
MRVEVIRAWPHRFESVVLDLPDGAVVADALAASGFADAAHAAIAIHGVNATAETALRADDRVEVLRPLLIDPKDARRRRARG